MDMILTCFPENCTGCTYPNVFDEDSQCFKASIICRIEEHEDKANQHPAKINFLVSVDDNKSISPTRKLNLMASRNLADWKHMIGQQGPLQLQPGDPRVQKFELQCEGGIGRR